MTPQEIEQKLIPQLTDILAVEPGAVTPDSSLEGVGMDSMRFVELFIFIEREFGLELISSNMQRSDLETPRAVAAAIARNL